MKIAICLSGEPREYKLTHESLKKYFYGYECDFFIHTWGDVTPPKMNSSAEYDKEFIEKNSQKYEVDFLYKDLHETYNPKEIFVQTREDFKANVLPHMRIPASWYDNICTSNWTGVSQIWSAEQSVRFVPENTYDVIVRTRFDIFYNTEDPIVDFTKTYLQKLVNHTHNMQVRNQQDQKFNKVIFKEFTYSPLKGFFIEFAHVVGHASAMKKLYKDFTKIYCNEHRIADECVHNLWAKCAMEKKIHIDSCRQKDWIIVRPGADALPITFTNLEIAHRNYGRAGKW